MRSHCRGVLGTCMPVLARESLIRPHYGKFVRCTDLQTETRVLDLSAISLNDTKLGDNSLASRDFTMKVLDKRTSSRGLSAAILSLAFAAALILFAGCSDSSNTTDNTGDNTNPPGNGGGGTPGNDQTIGAHGLVFTRLADGPTTLETPALSTFAAGSTIVVGVGRGDNRFFAAPTDNMGNGDYPQLGIDRPYTLWPGSGTALYALQDAAGGDGHVISTTKPIDDEVTMAVVEVYGNQVEDFVWNEVLSGQPLTSGSVTTSGPATLVAYWWGDADMAGEKTAVPDGGFTVIESILESGALVQCALAVAHVDAAGTYNVTWTATPQQGAQMWLVAIAD